MRRIIMLVTVLLSSCLQMAWGQSDSLSSTRRLTPVVVDDDDVVVGGTDDLSFGYQVPLDGNSAVNALLGRRLFDNPYSSCFFECMALTGWDHLAWGVGYVYLPQRIGAYTSVLKGQDLTTGRNTDWVALGVAVRPSSSYSTVDWQLYSGPVYLFGHRPGWEFGTRFASSGEVTRFSWVSGSVGVRYLQGETYFTIGLSLLLSGSVALFFL